MITSIPVLIGKNSVASAADRPRILAVFAHPDDESFCTGGTLARYAADGAEIMVVSATRGDAGQIRDARAATRRTLGHVREHEFRSACVQLGIQHAVCLDYGDGTLRDIEPDVLARRITRIVREFRPDVVITFGPDGGYGHPDHIAIGAATITACAVAGDAAVFPEQVAAGLAPHTPDATFHCSFPRSRTLLMERLARWLVAQRSRFTGSHDFMHALLVLAQEASLLGQAADHVDVQWYPAGFAIVEQGEAPSRLFLILSGTAEVIREDEDGTRRTVDLLEPGMFIGAETLAGRQVSAEHVVALENMTCVVFAPGEPTAFAGRGGSANRELDTMAMDTGPLDCEATTAIDVSAFVEHKLAAIAAHRTQCPLAPDMLPLALLQEIIGREYFVRVAPARRMETELLPRRAYAPIIRLQDRRPVAVAA